jgi:TRAP-type C4-dicarboxylate transport system substrate-binding protein
MTIHRAGLAILGAALALGAPRQWRKIHHPASHGESTDSALHKGWEVFEAYVESASGGTIAVEIARWTARSMTDAMEQAKIGAIPVGPRRRADHEHLLQAHDDPRHALPIRQ